MPAKIDHKQNRSHSQEVAKLLQSGTFQHARHMLKVLAAEETAHLIDASPPPSRQILWALIDEERRSDVMPLLGDELQGQFALEMDNEELVALSAELETDDMVDILQQLPEQVTREVLQAMSTQDRQRVATALSYPENTAGGLMNTDTITVRASHSVEVVLRYLDRKSVV